MSSLNTIAPEGGDSRGVAPATTVALLVVITVVLSIVTITGVFFISDDANESPPEAVIEVEHNSDGTATIAHRGGEAIPGENVRVTGPVAEQNPFEGEMFTAGDRATVELVDSGSAAVVWQSDDDRTSTVLRQFDISAENAPAQGNWTKLQMKLENNEDITLQNDYTPNSPNYDKEVDSGSWVPIDYSGVLDGNGHEIRGVTVDGSGSQTGFLASLGSGSEVKNLDVKNIEITGDDKTGFIGQTYGSVQNVHVENADIEGEYTVGALVGKNSGTITDSSAEGKVDGSGTVGGFVGDNREKITDSSADVSVTGTDWDVGGFVGMNYGGDITHSYAEGDVTSDSLKVGGLAGVTLGNITESYATGDVDGKGLVGGLTGQINARWWPDAVTVSDSYATGDVFATGEQTGKYNYVGGLSGFSRGQIETSYAVGNIIVNGAEYHVGGLLGGTNGNGNGNTIDSYWDTETTGQSVGIDAGPDTGTTGLTTANMRGSGALNNMFGSSSVWDTTGDYPVLEALDEQTQLDTRD